MAKQDNSNVRIKNKKAEFEYFLVEKFESGIVLTGTEIKSIRLGKVSINEAYCAFHGDELFLINAHITEYENGTYYNHNPKRERKLLLQRRELRKLKTKTQEKGFTIIPVMMYINEFGKAKITISLAKGKHIYDKRETIKQRDIGRDMERE